jgi:hypothetical protein
MTGIGTDGEAVLKDLACMTYEKVAEHHGWSRGRIYALALQHGARKNEARIRERREERDRRRRETLLELLERTATADVLDYMDSLPDTRWAPGQATSGTTSLRSGTTTRNGAATTPASTQRRSLSERCCSTRSQATS